MKSAFFASCGLVALLVSGLGDTPADACSSSVEVVGISTKHPDLPLSPFVAGHLGVLAPTYARSHLVIAYAWLTGKGLDPAAQRSLLELAQKRLAPVDAAKIAPGLAPAVAPDPVALWNAERARVLAKAASPTPAVPAAGYTSLTFAAVDNCLVDAFRVATDTLKDRETKLGAGAAELLAWVHAQDAVFANCADPEKKALPAPLARTASAQARADHAYQVASAYFYSNRWDEAEKRFRAIAADKTSPWSKLARYVVARVMVRRATLAHDTVDKPELVRAAADLDAQLRDPDLVTMHPSVRKYRQFVRLRVDSAKLLPEVSAKLAAFGLGADTGPLVEDYTMLLDLDEDVLAKAPASDDLTSFLGTMQGKRSFEFALSKHAAMPGSEAWLVASLMTATRPSDPRLAPLLTEALALQPSSPGYATARFHAIRLSAARGAARSAISDMLQKTRTGLGGNQGMSTRNTFAALAASVGPDLVTFLREAPIVPAGSSEDSAAVVFDPALPRAIPPELAEALALGVPLSVLKDATLSTVLPQGVRAHFAATTWTRAHLLGDRATATAVATVTGQLNPSLRTYIDKVERAHGDDERRLGLVNAILTFPTLGPAVDGWDSGPAIATALSSSSAGYFWCPSPPPSPLPSMPAFVTSQDRDAAKKERIALEKLGAGATWLANEAARVAEALPRDPRSAETLHMAVRATRFGCKDAKTSAASKRAFQTLHRLYPGSSWAKSTPYYY